MAASPSIPQSSSMDPLSPSTSLPRVCIIFPASSEDPDYRCDIFIVDLNCDGSDGSDLTPTFRVFGEFFDSVAFFVLERTLYVVEGCCGCDDICRHKKTKTIFKCILPSGSGSGVKLERSMLSRATNMNYMKTWPSAIPMPDGKKAVVFSSSVSYDYFDPRNKCDFELFDPAGGRKKRHKCEKLPQLQACGASSFRFDSFRMDSFSFIEKSVFLVHCEKGTYTLDLESPAEERCWKRLMIFPHQFQQTMHRFQLIGDSICLTPFSVFDFGVDDGSRNWHGYCYPDLPSPAPGMYDVTALDAVNDPRDCTFCILRTWTEEYSDMEGEDEEIHVPRIVLDVYRCDVVGCKKELIKVERQKGQFCELPCTRRVKSFKFWLEPRLCRDHCRHRYFSSIL